MTYQEYDDFLIEQARNMPHLRGDRSLQQQAQQAGTTAGQTSAGLLQSGQNIGGPLTSFAEGWMTKPPGFGTALPGMESTAGQIGNATSAGSAI